MTINFPKTLPYPTVQGYAIKPGEAIVRTEMEAGPARQRRRYTQTPSKISVRWIMNPEQFCLFEAWYKYQAKEGAEWFVISLLGGIGITEQDARFTQQFEASLIAGRLWQITTELEIRDRPTISEEAMDVISEIDLSSLEIFASKLHVLVHSSLPKKLN